MTQDQVILRALWSVLLASGPNSSDKVVICKEILNDYLQEA